VTPDTTPVWIAMGGVVALQLLGASLARTALRGRQLGFCLASGLLWGISCYGVLAAAVVLTRLALGALPLYPTSCVAGATGLAAALALAVSQLCDGDSPLSRSRALAGQAAGAAGAALVTLFAVSFDLSTLTPDSLDMIEAGLGLARMHDPQFADVTFLGGRGLLGVLIHAPASALPFDFLWFASPLLGLSCMATMATAAWAAVRSLGRNRVVAGVAVGLGTLWLLGCYFWLYQLFYVHVNQLAGATLLLFFVAAWRSLADTDDRWIPLAGLALLAFQMVRVEGTFFAALFTAVLVLERAAAGRRARPDLWLVLPGVAWCAVLAVAVEHRGGIVDTRRLLLMGGLLLGCLPLGWLARRPRLSDQRNALPGLALGALGLALLVLVAMRPEHMIERAGVLAWNAVGVGLWSTTWAFVPAVVLASPLLGRVPHQRFVQLALGAYFVGLLGLTYAGYWREGWYDSGNRMLTHALPSLVWLGMLRAAAIAPPRAEKCGERPTLSGGTPGDR
jgi:hypothetical protein